MDNQRYGNERAEAVELKYDHSSHHKWVEWLRHSKRQEVPGTALGTQERVTIAKIVFCQDSLIESLNSSPLTVMLMSEQIIAMVHKVSLETTNNLDNEFKHYWLQIYIID